MKKDFGRKKQMSAKRHQKVARKVGRKNHNKALKSILQVLGAGVGGIRK